MLGDKTAVATIAVKDLSAAKKFYGEVLGLKNVDDTPGGTRYKSGDSWVFVYPSEFAGTNKATAASWGVGNDLTAVVEDLKAKGVSFEKYDMPGVTLEGEVHVMGELKSAWFKDPDGNILNLVNQM